MKCCVFTLFFIGIQIVSLLARAENTKEIDFGTFYETNTFYSSSGPKPAEAFFIKPKADVDYKLNEHYIIGTDSNLEYDKYLKFANQSFFQYDVNFKNLWMPSKFFQISLTPDAKVLSEPAQNTDENRLQRQYLGTNLDMVYSSDGRRQYSLEIDYLGEKLNQSEYQFLNNTRLESFLYYKKYFLPETFFYYGLRLGENTYPQGLTSPVNRPKYNSRRIEPGIGLEGRLTKYFKLRSYIGYAVLSYAQDIGYRDPVYLVELEEELSPRDLVLMGFNNGVEDSYYTNYYLDETVYFGYGRFLGDRLLSTTKIQYSYRNYSRPNRRDDQRFALASNVEYSYSQTLKLDVDFVFDLLSSDAVNTGPTFTPDPSASYRNILLSFYAKYLF